MTDPPKCETCIFWVAHADPLKPLGQCRRWPPSLQLIATGLRSFWPLLRPNDWCGEHSTLAGFEERASD